jgi:hypothetical protein
VKARVLAALLAAGAAIALVHRLTRPAPAPEPVRPAEIRPAAGSAGPTGSAPAEGAARRETHAHVEPAAPVPGAPASEPAPASPAPGAAAAPMASLSAVPHRVLRAWGGGSGSAGPRELQLVVEPGLGTRELEQLLRDAVSRHGEAEVLTIRIYDSEEAASYDRHSDGGALAERHLVASMSRHRRLGVESLRVRGVELDP